MKISILCSSTEHPIYPFLVAWQKKMSSAHEVDLVQKRQMLQGGDILFLISCNELIKKDILGLYRASLVIHASDLPKGRGWSPHIWQILEGKKEITVSMLEAADKVDSGPIWSQRILHLEGHELHDEINDKLFAIECELMDFAVENADTIVPRQQDDIEATYYQKRTPDDSRIDPEKTLLEQFNLLRIADPARFPAFFDYLGHRYRIRIEKTEHHHGETE